MANGEGCVEWNMRAGVLPSAVWFCWFLLLLNDRMQYKRILYWRYISTCEMIFWAIWEGNILFRRFLGANMEKVIYFFFLQQFLLQQFLFQQFLLQQLWTHNTRSNGTSSSDIFRHLLPKSHAIVSRSLVFVHAEVLVTSHMFFSRIHFVLVINQLIESWSVLDIGFLVIVNKKSSDSSKKTFFWVDKSRFWKELDMMD